MKEEPGPFDFGNPDWWENLGYIGEGLLIVFGVILAFFAPLLFFL